MPTLRTSYRVWLFFALGFWGAWPLPSHAQFPAIMAAGGGVLKAASGSQPPSVCLQGNAFSDGCLLAPPGAAQYPNILALSSAVNGSGENYATRPPWNVAGVDYHAGCSTAVCTGAPGSAVAATDPANVASLVTCSTGGPPTYTTGTFSGTSITYAQVTVPSGADGCTISGFDFSLHSGTELVFASGSCATIGCTVSNDYFALTPVGGGQANGAVHPGICWEGSNSGLGPYGTTNLGCSTILYQAPGAGKVKVTASEFNGANQYSFGSFPVAGLSDFTNGAPVTLIYNYFHDCGSDCADFWSGGVSGVGYGSAVADFVRYNLFAHNGFSGKGHIDPTQWQYSVVSSIDESFNTVYANSASGLGGNALLMAGPSNDSNTTAVIANSIERDNTVISTSGETDGNFAVGFSIQGGSGPGGSGGASANHVAVYDNYTDPSGLDSNTGSPWMGVNKTGGGAYTGVVAVPAAWHDLINIVTGSTISVPTASNPAGFGYYVYPDALNNSLSISDIYSVTPSPASGNITTGNTITFTLALPVPWTIASGSPTISLLVGSTAKTATYTSGSGTNSWMFTYTAGSESGSGVSVSSINANGATFRDDVGNTNLALGTTNLTVSWPSLTVNVGGGFPACVQGTAYVGVGDGCEGAQVVNGSAVGSTQVSNFFTAHVPVDGSNPGLGFRNYTRPPWNVPGVDYPVGYTGTLFDPTNSTTLAAHISPAGCASSGLQGSFNRVLVTGANCTLDHLDFSYTNANGPSCVHISTSATGTVTFTNSKFSGAANASGDCFSLGMITGDTGIVANLLVKYSQFDDQLATSYPNTTASTWNGQAGIYTNNNGGTVTVEYSAFNFCPGACVQVTAHTGFTTNVLVEYSYLENNGGGGQSAGVHAEMTDIATQTNATANWTDQFDVYYTSPASCCGTAVLAGHSQVENSSTIGTNTEQYNIITSANYGSHGPSSELLYTYSFAGGNIINNFNLVNNYMDWTGTGSYDGSWGGFFYNGGGVIAPTNSTCTGNINMLGGATIVHTFSFSSSGSVACH